MESKDRVKLEAIWFLFSSHGDGKGSRCSGMFEPATLQSLMSVIPNLDARYLYSNHKTVWQNYQMCGILPITSFLLSGACDVMCFEKTERICGNSAAQRMERMSPRLYNVDEDGFLIVLRLLHLEVSSGNDVGNNRYKSAIAAIQSLQGTIRNNVLETLHILAQRTVGGYYFKYAASEILRQIETRI